MASPVNLTPNASLALASYANLSHGSIDTDQIVAEGFSHRQAEEFARSWTTIAQYRHLFDPYWIIDPATGQLSGPYTSSNGLSVIVFENKETGARTLAIRGTDDGADAATDFVSVFLLGSPKNQGQYQSLRTKVQEWIANGTLPQHFSVTGHSLGGFLATGLALEFPQYVDHAYLYNSPGLGGLTNRPVLDQIARIYHITGGSYDPTKFTNVRAKPGPSAAAGLGSHPSPPILIEGEDQGGYGVGFNSHSMKFLTDSLAVHDAFGHIGGERSLETVEKSSPASISDTRPRKLRQSVGLIRPDDCGEACRSITIHRSGARRRQSAAAHKYCVGVLWVSHVRLDVPTCHLLQGRRRWGARADPALHRCRSSGGVD